VFLLDRHRYYSLYTIYAAKGSFFISAPLVSDGDGTEDRTVEGIEELLAQRKREGAPSPLHPSWKQLACEHRWAFTPGHKSSIGCSCSVLTLQPAQ
jgi:hypothetical protein